MDQHLLNNPVTTVAVFLLAVVVLWVVLWALSKNWKALRAVQEELHGQIKIVVVPIIDEKITNHNRDEDAHEAAGIKVRKERNEMFNDLRDRIEEQHSELLGAITEIKTNQVVMEKTLSVLVDTFAKATRRQDDIERRVDYLQEQFELRRRRASDLNGLTFENVRHVDSPKRQNDPEGEDHRGERK